jgi:cellulose synthase/poly-beta-1,6-N-acetylglucosamine synthase-like glycosyltransferase
LLLAWKILLSIGGFFYLLLLNRIIIGLIRLKMMPQQASDSTPLVSIIIAARNEAYNIAGTLQSLLAQDYPRDLMEIIVVDDRSEDDTSEIAIKFSKNDNRIKLVRQSEITKGISPKKQALEKGIEASSGEIILTTDADCYHDPGWIRALVSAMTPEVGMVIGQARFTPPIVPPREAGGDVPIDSCEAGGDVPIDSCEAGGDVPIGSSKAVEDVPNIPSDVEGDNLLISSPPALRGGNQRGGRLWQRLQALDFQSLGYASAGLVAAGMPFNCTGASLAYRKQLFSEINGWDGYEKLISGDDELLLAKAAKTNWKIAVASSPEAIVETKPVSTLTELWHQRIRWGSKGLYYRKSRRIILAGVFLFLLLLIISPFIAIIFSDWQFFLIWTAMRFLHDWQALSLGSGIFSEKYSIPEFLILEFIYPLVTVLFAIGGHFSSFEWKGQQFHSKGKD